MTDATVTIVEDDPGVRESVADVLASGGYHVTTFPSAEAFLSSIERTSATSRDGASCLVLDVCLPAESGVELHHRLVERGATTPVIFMTAYEDVATTVTAMKGGAIDYLLKPVSAGALLAAVRDALSRDTGSRGASCASDFMSRVECLTPRERQVFDLVALGLLNKQIAARLGITMATVKAHRGRLTRKLAVTTIAELVRLADRIGSLAPST